jgi:hypothetical protein
MIHLGITGCPPAAKGRKGILYPFQMTIDAGNNKAAILLPLSRAQIKKAGR